MTYWPILPISFLAAAVANATAVGGGFLFVPLFIFVYGLPPAAAVKLGLATQAFGMTSGAFGWSRRFIVAKALLPAGVASVLGVLFGTLYLTLPSLTVRKVFGAVSIFIFVAIVLEIRLRPHSRESAIRDDRTLKTTFFSLSSFAGGLVTAWTAIGIGEVVALYLLFVYRIRVESAIATGVAVLALDSIAAFLLHAGLGGIEWRYLAFTAPGVALGGFFGARVARRVEAARGSSVHSPLKWTLAAVILVDGIVMLVHSYALS